MRSPKVMDTWKPSVLNVCYDQANKRIFDSDNDEFWTEYTATWKRHNKLIGFPLPHIDFYEYPHRESGEIEIKLRGLSIYQETLYSDMFFWPGRRSGNSGYIYEEYGSIDDEAEGLWTDKQDEFDLNDEDEPLKPMDVLFYHLRYIIRHNASELLMRGTVHYLVDNFKEHDPYLVDDIFPDRLKPHVLHQVLRRLLDNFISIRPLGRLLETIDENLDQAEGIDDVVDACEDEIGDISEFQFD